MSGSDPDYLYFLWRQPGFVNMGINDALDEMLEEQRALSGDARSEKVKSIHRYLLENSYVVPLVSPGWNWLMVSNSDVSGFKWGWMASLLFNDVTINN